MMHEGVTPAGDGVPAPGPALTAHVQDGPALTAHVQDGPALTAHEQDGPALAGAEMAGHDAAASPSVGAELRHHWPTLVGATVGVAFGSAALPFYTAGLFLIFLEKDLGWSRADLTAIGMIITLVVACTAPFAGALFDKVGVRRPALVGYFALAGGFLYMGYLAHALLPYAIVQIFLAILAIGTSPIAFTRPVNVAFDRMRGLALGILIGGIGVMAAVAPPVVERLIADFGWRGAFKAMAVAVLVMGPLALMLMGLRPPGQPAARVRLDPPPLAEIMRGWLFWRLVAAFVLTALAVAGFVTHFVPMLTDEGMSIAEAAGVAGLLGVAVLAGRLGVGWLMDRFFAPYVAAGVMLFAAGGLALLAVGGMPFARLGAIAIGLAMGGEVDLIAYMTARYFGMRHYGRMYGLFYGSFVIGTGTSPFLIALIQRAAGNYVPALWMSVTLLAIVALLFVTAPRFTKEETHE